MQILFKIIKIIYPMIIRPRIVSEIDNPDSEVDEKVMAIIDIIFGYKKGW